MDHRGGKKMDESTKREQLKQWLIREADLPQYLDHLTENGFEDVKSLKDLTKEYMDQIGIDKIGHQLKLLRLIRKMNGNNMVPEYSQHIMSEPPGPPHSHHVVQPPPHLNGYASSYHGHEHQDEMYNGTGSVATSVTYHEGPYSGQFSQWVSRDAVWYHWLHYVAVQCGVVQWRWVNILIVFCMIYRVDLNVKHHHTIYDIWWSGNCRKKSGVSQSINLYVFSSETYCNSLCLVEDRLLECLFPPFFHSLPSFVSVFAATFKYLFSHTFSGSNVERVLCL